MENNSDKLMRDKLKGLEFPYDPQAWDKMEAMLDKKEKRRGIFWWWFGGTAAVLLLVAGGYMLQQNASENSNSTTHTAPISAVNTQQVTTSPANESNTNAATEAGKEENTSNKLPNSNTASKNTNAGIQTKTATNEAKGGNSSNGLNQNKVASNVIGKESGITAANNSAGSGNTKHTAKAKSNMGTDKLTTETEPTKTTKTNKTTKPAKPAKTKKTVEDKTNGIAANNNQQIVNPVAEPALNTIGKSGAATGVAEGNAQLSLLMLDVKTPENLLGKLNEDIKKMESNDEEETVLKQKKRKKVFQYSIGVLANITAATTGNQGVSDNNDDTTRRQPLFDKRPSFMIGFNQEFMFFERFAITNSILYSETSFGITRANIRDNFGSIISSGLQYSSRISELAIPIGIKVYPVSTDNFRFYIHAGVINHIKIKETFNYVNPPVASNSLTDTTQKVSQYFPNQTSFNMESAMDMTQGAVAAQSNTNDFSINRANRYYLSFYASMGIEGVIKKNWVLFAEPMFYMNLQTIGIQERRKYNVGVSTGFRYQF